MSSVIDLLQEKNNCLEKFYRINEAGLEKFQASNFDHLEKFYADRDGLLAIIKKIDEMIERSNEIPLDSAEVDAAMRKIIIGSLQHKNDLVARILEQDLRILAAIEKEKSGIIKELSQVRATKKALGSYKSGQSANRLDEEA